MTSASQIAWDDMILPFQLDRADVRGRMARLDGVLDRILGLRDHPPPVADLLAEACLLTALIGQAIKLRWRLSLQVRGEGPVRLIATDYFGPEAHGEAARLRAYAGYDGARLPGQTAAPFGLFGRGLFGIMIDQGPGTTPYQGVTPLAGGSLAACAAIYFAQSEQIPTRFHLTAARAATPGEPERWRAGGIMLQLMPKFSRPADAPSGADGLVSAADLLDGSEGEDWSRVNHLLDTAEAHELIGPHVTPERLLLRLFHEEIPRVFDAQPARFGCTCSAEKALGAVTHYPPEELAGLLTPDGKVAADCAFCGAHYEVDPAVPGAGSAGPRAS
jgi:molecular chaperone Hsp33